jgi:hypothetical protein
MLYNLLPFKAVEGYELGANHKDISNNNISRSESINKNGKNTSKHASNDDKIILLPGIKEGMLKIICKVFINNEKWQRQETSLIISYEIIQNSLSASLDDMSKKEWIECTLSNEILSLLHALRPYFYLAALHPMFEIRRMIGQILPIIARATILFQSETLLIEADFITQSIDDNGISCARFESDTSISTQSYDSVDMNEYNADSKAVVLCAWLAALCKAAQHIIELDMIDMVPTNNKFQQSLKSYGIRTLTIGSVTECNASGFTWAMEISGRLSEENSKKEFSNGLESVLLGENGTAYMALARSLSYVKSLLSITVPLFWSRDGNNCNISNGNSSSDAGSNMNNNIQFKNLRKILPQECISCDFIDAAILSTALLLRMNPDHLDPNHPDSNHPDPNHPDPNHPDSNHPDSNTDCQTFNLIGITTEVNEINKHEIENCDGNNNSDNIDVNKIEGPLFLNLIKVITKVARDITEQQLSRNSSRMMSSSKSPAESSKGAIMYEYAFA